MNEAIRLDKHLVALIQCSRGEAQKYIEGGWVLVDGEVIDQPQFKVLEQKVELHTDANLTATLPRTMLLNLPEGFDVSTPTAPLQLITPETHTGDDRSGIRVLKRHFARLMPTAPIELGASGLMVFSQDGKIVRKLVEEAKTNEQEYTVDVSGEIEPDGLQQLNSKIIKNGWPLPSAKVSWQSETRLRIGRVSMGKLLPGEWRYLPEDLWF